MIFEYEEENKQFIVRATHGLSDSLLNELQENPIHLGEGAVGRAAVTREPTAFANVEDGTYEPRLRDTMIESGFRAILVCPYYAGMTSLEGCLFAAIHQESLIQPWSIFCRALRHSRF